MRYDDWPSHQRIQHKLTNQHVKQEYIKYIIKCSTKRVYKLHSVTTMKELATHDDVYN